MGDPGHIARDFPGEDAFSTAEPFRPQRGMSLIELLGAVAVSSVALLVSLLLSQDWILRQAARSAVYEVQSHLQLARAHAITRSHLTRFVIDASTRRIEVFDLNDPGDAADDILLAEVELSRTVEFDRPDPGAAITLDLYSGSRYQAVFAPEGSVQSSPGEIVVEGAGAFHKVSLMAAGGVGVRRWDGASWVKGG